MTTAIDVVPDWIGEVLSKSTRGYDLVTKRHFYAEMGVKHLWYVEPLAQTLSVSRLENGPWLELKSAWCDRKDPSRAFRGDRDRSRRLVRRHRRRR